MKKTVDVEKLAKVLGVELHELLIHLNSSSGAKIERKQ